MLELVRVLLLLLQLVLLLLLVVVLLLLVVVVVVVVVRRRHRRRVVRRRAAHRRRRQRRRDAQLVVRLAANEKDRPNVSDSDQRNRQFHATDLKSSSADSPSSDSDRRRLPPPPAREPTASSLAWDDAWPPTPSWRVSPRMPSDLAVLMNELNRSSLIRTSPCDEEATTTIIKTQMQQISVANQ